MNLWAVVPVKPLHLAKSRLASLLSPAEREALAAELLRYNLSVLAGFPQLISGVLVVSRDLKALALARSFVGVQTLQESGTPQLNHALHLARQTTQALGANATLILPADLPLVRQDELEKVIMLGRTPNTLVIVPDRHHDGTNALLLNPSALIELTFGQGSFANHLEAAQKRGAHIEVFESEHLGLDLDVPEDLIYYSELAHKLGEKLMIAQLEQKNS